MILNNLKHFIILLFIVTIISLIIIITYALEQVKQQSEIIESERIITIEQISERMKSQIQNSLTLLEVASNNQNIINIPNISDIDDKLHGIPEHMDSKKRIILKNIVDTHPYFEDIVYTLPNGDVYMAEPYNLQQSLPASNFSYRDWYEITVQTNSSYLSNILISTASGNPITVVTMPVMSEDGEMVGILAAAINLARLQELLGEFKSYTNEKITIIDNTGTILTSSDPQNIGKKYLESDDFFKHIDKHTIGTGIDTINNVKMFIAHNTIKIAQNEWYVISIQPYDSAFSSINATVNESIYLTITISGIFIFTFFIIQREFKMQTKLREQAEKSNDMMKNFHRLLLSSEEKFRNFYILSPYAIMIMDKEGKIKTVNEQFELLFQYSNDDIVGKPFSILVSNNGQDLTQKYFKELQEVGSLKDKENWLKRKDGTEFPALFSSNMIPDSSAKTDGYISIIIDQTDAYQTKKLKQQHSDLLKEHLEKLKSIDKQKDEFASMISHELQTPLFPIKFHAKMLKDPTFGELNEKQMTSINEIYHNAERLERLISDLLDNQRIDLGTMTFKFTEIKLDELMNDIHDENIIYMKEKNISFTNNTSNGIVLKIDSDRVKQVFSNLIKNSVDFVSDKGGKIEIGATKENDSVLFFVKDNGIGMSKEKQSKLFTKFYQIDISLTRKHGGTGLGLSICKGIVEGLGGKIWIDSEYEKGTSVFFSIPINVN